ncbi:pyruvate ferredoxin oxidoreductase gamma subunit [Candidatus Hakubella thermalkaliphila]|uniref:Pyruvate ferredoxin oxidoreductase gamma subunit n=1 Tax=Candidatus Hakubella thermalkaliphila TaxID=2754717 RepID=A0A6V8PBW6_9ACTN|nr:2-oxoacid:acceptor oxidoreductase family protein [Candidatus Hakubella thermalkaliphila]GFP18907.1 pyruvate ferredoxin oxidoreductase gamma subunit [Candidatus Hakubella thermalkaliphila]GFP29114.1 pyruvate ferredoxin oxidoreductase gamma subunit [Candidatus Hakubella thermalkaliphila]GFP36829.1 pyruvate ferredoxin oxidoreductase gamma subunit [Candidatus Hakubella thermalkaliphila]GFP38379.1 pyruvate ferredoxin oxidoreductase gamma subunit [Candidatus Hakubella thermalkaliphila]GFP42818.1 
MVESAKLPYTNELGFYEMRFESIGGLGANLAGQILAEAMVLGQGLNGASFSSYGSEKKGSPIKSFVRLCAADREVRTSSPVERPHLLAIFHEALTGLDGTTEGLTSESTVVVNTTRTPAEMRDILQLPSGRIGVVDALGIAVQEKTRLNTAMLGAITQAAGFIDREVVRKTIADALSQRYPSLVEPNLRTFDRGYHELVLEDFAPDGKYDWIPFTRFVPALGYANVPLGGTIINPGNTILKDLSPSRQGFVPLFHRDECIDCGKCEMTCPDYCFVWEEGVDKRGRPAMVLQGIDYQHCKGCLKCVEICPVEALTMEREEPELVRRTSIELVGPPEALVAMERSKFHLYGEPESPGYWDKIS